MSFTSIDQPPHFPTILDSIKNPEGNKLITVARKSDGYIDASRMCGSVGKDIKNYLQLEKTTEFLSYLKSGISHNVPSDLIKINNTGPTPLRGTWVYFLVALDIATWLSSSEIHLAVFLYMQSQLVKEAVAAKEVTVNRLQGVLDEKVYELTSLTESLQLKEEAITSISNQMDLLSDEVFKKNMCNPLAFGFDDWSDAVATRCYYQSCFRHIAAFLVQKPENRNREKFKVRLSLLMLVVLNNVFIPNIVSPVSAYRILCKCIKARYFHSRNITDKQLVKVTTSSFIQPFELYFILVQFQEYLESEGEIVFVDSLDSTIDAIEEKFQFNKRMLDQELTVVVANWI